MLSSSLVHMKSFIFFFAYFQCPKTHTNGRHSGPEKVLFSSIKQRKTTKQRAEARSSIQNLDGSSTVVVMSAFGGA